VKPEIIAQQVQRCHGALGFLFIAGIYQHMVVGPVISRSKRKKGFFVVQHLVIVHPDIMSIHLCVVQLLLGGILSVWRKIRVEILLKEIPVAFVK
jgi:hypothetical protein